jgi:hypothetical protein
VTADWGDMERASRRRELIIVLPDDGGAMDSGSDLLPRKLIALRAATACEPGWYRVLAAMPPGPERSDH